MVFSPACPLEQLNENKLILNELAATFEKAIDSLPGQCCEIFIMCRFENMKYHEIADKLGISVKNRRKEDEHLPRNTPRQIKRLLLPFPIITPLMPKA